MWIGKIKATNNWLQNLESYLRWLQQFKQEDVGEENLFKEGNGSVH